MIYVIDSTQTFVEQLNSLFNAYSSLLSDELQGSVAIFKRFFISDAANQSDKLQAILTEESDCATSIVEQPPLNGTKVALWAYLQTNVQATALPNGLFKVSHGGGVYLYSPYTKIAVAPGATIDYKVSLVNNSSGMINTGLSLRGIPRT